MGTVQNEGAEISFDMAGSGDPILLIAGTGYSGSTWHPRFVDALSEHHTVVTFDHRGTGKSTRGLRDDATTALFARDALAVLDSVGAVPAHVVGHSMGGRVAQAVYLQRPSAVVSLTLAASGSGASREPEFSRVGIPIGATEMMIEHGYEEYIRVKHRQNFFTESFVRDHPDEVIWLDEAYLASSPTLHDYLRHVRARQAHSTTAQLTQISAPVLIIVGSDDHGGSASHVESSKTMAGLLPRCELVVIDGAKHGIMWENRDDVSRLIVDFAAAHRGDH